MSILQLGGMYTAPFTLAEFRTELDYQRRRLGLLQAQVDRTRDAVKNGTVDAEALELHQAALEECQGLIAHYEKLQAERHAVVERVRAVGAPGIGELLREALG